MAIAVTMTGLGSEDGTVNQYVLANVGAATVAGRCLLAFVVISDTAKSVTSMTDDTTGGPMVYSQIAALTVTGVRIECWATAYNGTKANASYIKANLSGMTPAAITVAELSGALALGINGTANNTTANPTKTLATQDANNYVVAGFGSVGATLATGLTGTLERTKNSAGTNPVVCSLVDNTAVGAGNVTDAITLAATTWAAVAVELRTVAAGLFATIYPTPIVEVELAGAGLGWTNIAADVVGEEGLHVTIGMAGGGPGDRVASTGLASFALRNDAKNSASLLGYYSPYHANKRSGWGLGIGCRIRFYNPNDGATWTRMVGRIDAIDPAPGLHLDRRVRVTVVDWLDQAARWMLTAKIGEQRGHTADFILSAILAVMPAQPAAMSFDVGTETYVFALDSSSSDRQSALAEFAKLAASEFGLIYLSANGTFTFKSRHARLLTTTSLWTLLDTTQRGLEAPSTRDDVINTARVTAHPKTVDATPTTVVYAQANPIFVEAGATKHVLGPFRDPVTGDPIGATEVQPQAPWTDYVANLSADGTGTDLTVDFVIVSTEGASGVEFQITNNNASGGWLTANRIRAKGVYDRGTQQYEARDTASVLTYGERVLNIDMAYQDNGNVAQGAADYLVAKFKTALALPRTVTVVGTSPATMTQLLTRDVNDRITVNETVTGIATDYFINAVQLTVGHRGLLEATYTLAPAYDPFGGLYWIVGTSTLGTDTIPAPF